MSTLPPASAQASSTASNTIGGLSPNAFSSMFQAISGLRNRRALIAMLGCMVAGLLVAGLFTMLAGKLGFFMAFLGGLAFMVASAAGINAAGVLLMEQAKGIPPRGLVDAVVYGLMCIPKLIVLWLALFLAGLAVIIVMTVVYFICKIPFLGPLMFVVVFPLSVVISGLTFCGLSLCMFLALPAIWEGATLTRAIAQALAIARSRLVESMLLMAVVWLLALAVGVIVFGVLLTGLMPMVGLSASILGGNVVSSMTGMMHGYAGMGGYDGGGFDGGGGSTGHVLAAAIGGGVLWALAGSVVSLVYLLGLNLVYLRVTEGLDVGAAEAAMRSGLDEAKRQAVDLGQKAKDAAERAREQARVAAAAAQARAAANSAASAAANADAQASRAAAQAPTPTPVTPPVAPAAYPMSTPAAAPVVRPAAPPSFNAPPPFNPPAPVPPPAPLPPPPAFSPSGFSFDLPEPPPKPSAPTQPMAATCPHCLSPVSPDDLFCGVCGYKLK